MVKNQSSIQKCQEVSVAEGFTLGDGCWLPIEDLGVCVCVCVCVFRPVFPQSEVLVKFVQETGEKCGENLAKNFADFRPSISRENVRKKCHEESSTFSPLHHQKVLSLLQLWEVGAPSVCVCACVGD